MPPNKYSTLINAGRLRNFHVEFVATGRLSDAVHIYLSCAIATDGCCAADREQQEQYNRRQNRLLMPTKQRHKTLHSRRCLKRIADCVLIN